MVQAFWIKLLTIAKQKSILNDFLNPCFDNLRGQSDPNSTKQRIVPGFISMWEVSQTTFPYQGTIHVLA